MVKILYGLCGEGLGHASRGRILIRYLKKRHEIRIVAGGKAFSYMSKEFDNVYKIHSPHFVYRKGGVRLFLTILRMIFQTFIMIPFSFLKIRKILKEFKPDILLTDAEPISFYASFFSKIKRICIDNQQSLFHRNYDIRFGDFFAWFALFIILKLFFFNADKYIIYDFFDEQIKNNNVLFIKLLVQDGILKQKAKDNNHIFVYQTSISSEFICNTLKDIDERFIIYGFDKELFDENLVFKKFNDLEFYKDISTAKAIITNGGFTVLSEALYLKKPIFSMPIKNQYEQIVNAQFIKKIGAGVYKKELNKEDVLDFLQHLNFYKENLKNYNPGSQKETLKIIEDQINSVITSS